VGRTLLVEKLVEREEWQLLADLLPAGDRADAGQELADCEEILTYLEERFAEQNHLHSLCAASSANFCRMSAVDAAEAQPKLADMDDVTLLRYGSVLKYLLCAEACLHDVPLDVCRAKLGAAQIEWRRRFGDSVIADSI
jgi:hypothetical protein